MHILQFASTVCLLIVSTSSTKNIKISNKKPPIPDTELDKEPFKDTDYDDFVNTQKTLIQRTSLVTVHYLEELFPDLEPSFCGDETCNTPMYEIVNSAVGSLKISKMPTVLLIGGIHGMETLGVSLLVNLIRLIQKVYTKHAHWFRILNNVRLLVVPALDVQALYYAQYPELIPADFVYVDPFQDFSLSPKKDCFQSFASQAVFKIYQQNLIFSALVFTKKDFKIRGPRLSEVSGVSMTYPDKIYNEMVRDDLAAVYNNLVRDQSISLDNVKADVNLDTTRVFGTFLEWSFGASENPKLASSACIKNRPRFISVFKKPSENSNRAFTVEVGLSKDAIKDDIENLLGNELGLIWPEHPEARTGVLTQGIKLVRQFVEYSRPFASVKMIETLVDDHAQSIDDSFGLNFKFQLKGCFHFTEFSLNSPAAKIAQIFQLDFKKFTESLNTEVSIKITFHKDQRIDTQTALTYAFDFDCMDPVRDRLKGTGDFLSHLVRAQLLPEYNVQYNGQSLSEINLRNYQVKNVAVARMEGQLLYERSHSSSVVYYTDLLMVKLGGNFPLLLRYSKDSSEATLELVKHNIEDRPSAPAETDYMIEAGIVNQQAGLNSSRKVLDSLSHLRTGENIRMFVFNSYMRFICSNMLISKIRDKHDRIADLAQSQKQQVSHKLDPKARRSGGPVTVTMSKEEMLARLRSNDPCYSFSDSYVANQADNLYFMRLDEGVPQVMLESVFIVLIGKYLRVDFDAEEAEAQAHAPAQDRNLLKHVREAVSPKHFSINGSIALVDPDVTGELNNTVEVPRIPDNFELLSKEPVPNNFPFNTGSSCTSVFPVFPVTDEDLVAMGSSAGETQPFREYFYALYITQDKENPQVGNVTLYSVTPDKFSQVVLAQKSKKFVLKKTSKLFELEGDYIDYRSEIVTFQGSFPLEELHMNSQFVTVFDSALRTRLFDCFLVDNSKAMDLKNIFMVYKDLELAATELIPRQSSLFTWLVLVVLVCLALGVWAGIYFVMDKYDLSTFSDVKRFVGVGADRNEANDRRDTLSEIDKK